MKKYFRLISAFTLLLLASCTPSAQKQMSSPINGLQITDMKISVGSAKGSTDTQVVSYVVTVYNSNSSAITLDWLEPVLEDSTTSRVLDPSLQVEVGRTIAPNSGLVVNGSFTLNTSGLSKADMKNWHFIDLIKCATDVIVPVPLGGSKS